MSGGRTWAQRHRSAILLAIAALAVGGVLAAMALPVSLFPRTSFPRVLVSVDAGSRPVDRMEVEVTVPLEQAVRAVLGARRVRSKTSRGSAEISVDFSWGTDMVSTALQVESAINKLRPRLPAGTIFNVRWMDPTVFPVLGYTLTSSTHSLTTLRSLAQYQLLPRLQTIPGVARVAVLGGASPELQVVVDPGRLVALGVAMDDVVRAVGSANDVLGIGRTEDLGHLYLVLGRTELRGAADIRATPVGSVKGRLVRVQDVATVQPGVRPEWSRVRADGRQAVIFQVYQQPDGATTQIASAVERTLAEAAPSLPKGVKIANWYDQSELIRASAVSVRDALIIGVILAFVVLLLFLRDVRVATVAILTVPVTLAVTSLLLQVVGQSFNIMTLGGMAAAVGLVIDDALVMVEHIVRRLPRLDGPLPSRVAAATREFYEPLLGSSMVTIIIFAPMAFVGGVSGAFFKPLSLTIAMTLGVSLLIAMFGVPTITELLLSDRGHHAKSEGRVMLAYRRFLAWVLRRPWVSLIVVLPVLAAGAFAFTRTGSGFMPRVDEGGFVLDYVAPAGTSLTETDRRLRQIGEILTSTPEVRTYSRRTGLALGGGLVEANEGDFFVRLVPQPRAPLSDVMERLRAQIDAQVPGLEIEMALLMEDLIGDLIATPQPIEISIFSDDLTTLRPAGQRIARALREVHGVVDVKSGVVLAGDAWEIEVDRGAAALEGVTAKEVSRQLGLVLDGRVVTQMLEGPKTVGVRVWSPNATHLREADLLQQLLRAPDGHRFALKRVAHIQRRQGQAQIAHSSLKRMIAITGRISGRDLGSVIADVKGVLSRPGMLPPHGYYTLGGLYREQQQAFHSLLIAFGSAVALIFVVLLYFVRRVRVALCTLLPAMGAAASSFVGLWVTGIELNITAIMGLIMVVGIVTEVSVFLVFEARASHAASASEALIEACIQRSTPIIMTSLVASLALIPIALGIGEGAQMLRPMAVAIIAGLIVKLPLALVALPAALEWVGFEPGNGE